jgi:hypothetical protein
LRLYRIRRRVEREPHPNHTTPPALTAYAAAFSIRVTFKRS